MNTLIFQNQQRKQKNQFILLKNGEGDFVLMSIEAFEKREQMLDLRAKVIQTEEERLSGEKTLSIDEARKKLKEKLNEI